MELEKLSKQELCVMCNDLGFTKYKSKSKSKLIELIYTKSKKPILENVVETDENVVETDENVVETDENVVETNMELNKIYNEDCVTGMMKINDNSVDIIICDPPYNIGKDFGNNSDKQKMDDYLLWCDSWISQCLRILKPNGTLYIYGFSEILSFIRTRIYCNVRWLIWHYTNKNVASLNFWQRSHESIIVLWKDDKVFHRDDVREPYTDVFLNCSAGKKRANTKGRFSNGKVTTTYIAHPNGALPRDGRSAARTGV